ncbi:MAG: carboxypeptidase regulatory-like domain-containing protein [Myxococcales bacterium]|nr:carboxypeptidase regulatory-like domain-containing protein [Myxococcales bacterium]
MRRLLVMLALAASGCGSFVDGPPTNRCTSDADCTMASCNTDLGMCVSEARRTVRIGLEVRPMTEPYGGSVQAIPFEPFEVAGPIERDLELSPGVIVQGIVRASDGTPVSTDLAFTRQSTIPGASATTITLPSSGANPPTLEAGRAAAFLTQILPGRHELSVTPTGDFSALLPPMNLVYETPENGDGYLEIAYPPVCDDPTTDTECLAVFEGQVADPDGRGQAGVVVKLIDRASGRTVSSRYVTATDPELDPGYFRLYLPVGLWHSTDAWFLRVSPAPHRVEEVGPSPTYTRSAEALSPGDDGLIRVLSPDVSELRIAYSGTVESPDGQPLADASVRFTATEVTDPVTNITGSYTTTVRTDETGRFSAELLGHPEAPASYEIVVTPSQSDTELGILRDQRTLGSDSNGQLFTVPARSRFGGTVQTGAGLRMIDARVEARTQGSDRDGTLEPVAFLARSSQTTTDPMGLFDLRLDVGLYDVVIEPPAGTNFPWRIERDVAIGGSMAPLSSVYELDNPVPITGIATWSVDGTTQPVVEGEVRAYAVIEADDGSVRALLVGRATTDARGAYTLLLPPSI